jgi:hypothetical protein
VPKSKGRKKKTSERPYVPKKERKKPRSSPPWYPFFFLGLMGLGILIIVLNYMKMMVVDVSPWTAGTSPYYLWVGLGFIAAGFLAATGYR